MVIPAAHQTWYPRGLGPQPLYTFRLRLTHADGSSVAGGELDRRIGFRRVSSPSCCQSRAET